MSWFILINPIVPLSANRFLILSLLFGLLAIGGTAQARNYRTGNGAQHFLYFSVAGGEANTCLKSANTLDERGMHTAYPVKNSIGADAQAELSYEIRKSNFLFGIFGNAQFTYTGVNADSLCDSYLTKDIQNDDMYYRYNYVDFQERQQTLWVGGGLRAGYYFLPNAYFALGAKVQMPLCTQYHTATQLSTTVMWPFATSAVVSQPGMTDNDYGLYAADLYTEDGKYNAYSKVLMVTPMLEIGTHLHIANRFYLRVAGYAEYGIPVGRTAAGTVLVDYSKVDFPEKTQNYIRSHEVLMRDLHINSAMDYAGKGLDLGRFAVGVKLSLMLDVTTHIEKCNTCMDDSWIPFSSRYSRGRSGGIWSW